MIAEAIQDYIDAHRYIGKWSDLSVEERRRAKIMMYGGAANVGSDGSGYMKVEHLKRETKPSESQC